MPVTVVGVDARTGPDPVAARVVARAGLLVGSAENLALVGAPAGVERVVLGPLAPALERLAGASDAVVVAAGDPGLFGIVRALRAAGHDPVVLPGVSSPAAVFARLGLPWDDAVVVSAHGRPPGHAVNACRALGKVAVLTGPGAGPGELARQLDGWERELVVAERLGRDGGRLRRAPAARVADWDPADVSPLSTVVCLDGPALAPAPRYDNQPAAAPEEGWALPEDAYQHRAAMITKAEVRAWAVARLRPRLGRLVLDLGAGSGSVGVECNRLGAAVACVERDAAACALIARNAARHGARIRVVHDDAAALDRLPPADAAFVGGGGPRVVAAAARHAVPLVVAAFAALDHALAAHRVLTDAGYRVEGSQLSASRLAPLPGGSLRLAAANPVLVLTGERA